jgi:hypothetical protein
VFLYQPAENNFLDNRVDQYGQEELPGFDDWPTPLNSRLLDKIQYQPACRSGQQCRQEQTILPKDTLFGNRRSQVTQLLFSC